MVVHLIPLLIILNSWGSPLKEFCSTVCRNLGSAAKYLISRGQCLHTSQGSHSQCLYHWRVLWEPDESGIDLTLILYFSVRGNTKKWHFTSLSLHSFSRISELRKSCQEMSGWCTFLFLYAHFLASVCNTHRNASLLVGVILILWFTELF